MPRAILSDVWDRLWQHGGLRQVLFGLLIVAVAFDPWFSSLGTSVGIGFNLVTLLLILANLILPAQIDAYYARQLAPLNISPPAVPTGSLTWSGCLVGLPVVALLIIAIIWLTNLRLQVDILLFLLAIGLVVLAVLRWNDHKIYLALALFALGVSCLPLIGFTTVDQFYARDTPVGMLNRATLGLVLLVSGLYDHLLFMSNVHKLTASQTSA